MDAQYFNTKEASRLLNIERATLYLWRNKGKIKMEKFDGQYYISAQELQPILEQRLKTGKTHNSSDFTGNGQHLRVEVIQPVRKYIESESQ
ncbi:MAG TPA: hypothetical protein DEF78_06245 [Sphingobacterium sp.]|nr:hypothetical protein [Sphingobacterium sp.]